jgi:hypothetical protein
MLARRRIGIAPVAVLLPCPFLVVLAACGPRVSALRQSDVSSWEVSVESPVDAAGRAADTRPAPGDVQRAPGATAAGDSQPASAVPPSQGQTRGAQGGGAGAGDAGASATATGDAAAPHSPTRSGDNGRSAAGAHAGNSAPGGGVGALELPDDPELGRGSPEQQIAALRAALAVERQRRQAVELQLQRLKEETSTPPFGTGMVPETEVLAAKQEIVDLRRALDAEHAARQQLAEELLTLQERLANQQPADTAESRAQQEALQAAQRAAAASFTHSFSESQTASADLDQHVTSAAVAVEDGNVAAVRAENAALRSRLDEQHRRTQELAEKLKVATRVADLIFKMEAQPADGTSPAPRAAPARPAPAPARARAPRLEASPAPVVRRAAPPPDPRFSEGDAAFDDEMDFAADVPTPSARATRTPTATPRLSPTIAPTPTPQRRTPVAPAMPFPA